MKSIKASVHFAVNSRLCIVVSLPIPALSLASLYSGQSRLLQGLYHGVVTLLLLQRMDALQMTSLHAETSGCLVLLRDTERMRSGQR